MIWIIVQAILFAALLFVPVESDISTPEWFSILDLCMQVLGFLILLRAAYDLRASLAIAPKPREHGTLQSEGIYRFVRHPMYLAVWLIFGAGVLNSGSFIRIGLYVLLVGFFLLKIRHEERLLVKKYPSYKKYMRATGRIIPRLRLKDS